MILEKEQRADPCYGLYDIDLTIEEVMALIKGKRVYFTVGCGEYAVVLRIGDWDEVTE